MEQARYEARRAERQHELIDPENRQVARELEQRWERLLLEQHKLEEEYDRFLHEQAPDVTKDERQACSDYPPTYRESGMHNYHHPGPPGDRTTADRTDRSRLQGPN